jgi:hypothetical protein
MPRDYIRPQGEARNGVGASACGAKLWEIAPQADAPTLQRLHCSELLVFASLAFLYINKTNTNY